MSVVLAYQSPYGLILGSDCAVTFTDGTQMPAEPKVWAVGDMLYGLVGDSKFFTKLRYEVVWPGQLDTSTALEYAVNHVMPRVEMALEDMGDEQNWELLIGHPMGVVYVSDDGSIELPKTLVMGIGSGGKVAMTTAEVLTDLAVLDPRLLSSKEDAEAMVEASLLRACERDAYCGQPIVLLSLEDGDG